MSEDCSKQHNYGFWRGCASTTWALGITAMVLGTLSFFGCMSCLGLATVPFMLLGALVGL